MAIAGNLCNLNQFLSSDSSWLETVSV